MTVALNQTFCNNHLFLHVFIPENATVRLPELPLSDARDDDDVKDVKDGLARGG